MVGLSTVCLLCCVKNACYGAENSLKTHRLPINSHDNVRYRDLLCCIARAWGGWGHETGRATRRLDATDAAQAYALATFVQTSLQQQQDALDRRLGAAGDSSGLC